MNRILATALIATCLHLCNQLNAAYAPMPEHSIPRVLEQVSEMRRARERSLDAQMPELRQYAWLILQNHNFKPIEVMELFDRLVLGERDNLAGSPSADRRSIVACLAHSIIQAMPTSIDDIEQKHAHSVSPPTVTAPEDSARTFTITVDPHPAHLSYHAQYTIAAEQARTEIVDALKVGKIYRKEVCGFVNHVVRAIFGGYEYAPMTTVQELLDGGHATRSFRCQLPPDHAWPITEKTFTKRNSGFSSSTWSQNPGVMRHVSRGADEGRTPQRIVTRKSSTIGYRVYAILAHRHYCATRRVCLDEHQRRPLGVVLFVPDGQKYAILDTPECAYIPLSLNDELDACPTWEARSSTFGLLNYKTGVFNHPQHVDDVEALGVPPCSLTPHSPLYILHHNKSVDVIDARLIRGMSTINPAKGAPDMQAIGCGIRIDERRKSIISTITAHKNAVLICKVNPYDSQAKSPLPEVPRSSRTVTHAKVPAARKKKSMLGAHMTELLSSD